MMSPYPELEDPQPGPEDAGGGRHMGILGHLEELRWTLIKCALVFAAMVSLIAIFLGDAATLLNWPLQRNAGRFPELAAGLITNSPMGVFSVVLQICLLGGLIASLPFMLFFIGQFVAPALTAKERRLVFPSAASAFGLFLLGGAFGYLLIAPGAVRVAMELNQFLGYKVLWTADTYYGLVVWLVLGMGATFEFPLVILLLIQLRIVGVATFRRWRRFMIIVFFVVAAIITPTPDPFTQTMVALPMWALFEISLLIGARAERRHLTEEEQGT